MSSCEKQGLEAVLQSGFFFLGDDVKAVQNGTLPLADLEQTPCRVSPRQRAGWRAIASNLASVWFFATPGQPVALLC